MDTVCELGAQELNLKERYLPYYSKFPFDNLNIENYLSVEESNNLKELKVEDIYKKISINNYSCIDLNGLNNSLKLDLNEDLQSINKIDKKFSLVTNFGTSEHCSNQFNFFKNSHELCKVNGYMIGIVPFQKALNHGFFNYQPIFFSELAKANNYDLELFWSASYDDVYSTYFVDYSDELLHEFSNYQKNFKRDNHYGSEEELGYIFKKNDDSKFSTFSQVYDDKDYSLAKEKRKVVSKNYKYAENSLREIIINSNPSIYNKFKTLLKFASKGEFKVIFNKIKNKFL